MSKGESGSVESKQRTSHTSEVVDRAGIPQPFLAPDLGQMIRSHEILI